ncbi:N-terminal cleavage protein [Burkholderia sp. NRF60-BP8]|nr:N-terminal cleavage protein [Burkholderia sp. NRF60-BP8]KVA17859.1 N-terminal cleavage protein [Burkholderia sp. NRF60-BP8]
MIAMRHAMRGTSLIEATLAIALLATVMLAVAGSQLAMARAQRATIWRERALWLADARIERLHAAAAVDDGLAALAAASLPDGAMTLDGGPGGVRYAIVRWRGGNGSAPPRCDAAGTSTRPPSCVRMPFRERAGDER